MVLAKMIVYVMLISVVILPCRCNALDMGNAVIHRSVTTPASDGGLTPCRMIRSRVTTMSSTGEGENRPPFLTVIIPAYNEVLRIGETLQVYSNILASSDRWSRVADIVVVDDGSTDGTAEFVRQFQHCRVPLSCVSLSHNQGKGAALSFGIHHVGIHHHQGGLILIADADGSGDMRCLDAVFRKLTALIGHDDYGSPGIVVGNRGYQGASLTRSILRWGFRTCVRLLCGNLRVQDTQCGFKLMTVSAARLLYTDLHLPGWTHDVEVLYRAKEMALPVGDVVVDWQDKDGSKLVDSPGGTVGVSVIMLLDIVRMRIEYARGNWKVPTRDE